jgi:AAHS family 4-hydroxybenzoate transporter-like MFS transporter
MLTISGSLIVTLVAFGFVLEEITVPSDSDYRTVVVLYGLSGAIFSAGIASLYALMTHAYPSSCRSAGIGFGIFVGRIGAISATGLGGWLIDLGGGSLMPFFAVLVVSAALFSAAPFIVDRHVPPARRSLAGA